MPASCYEAQLLLRLTHSGSAGQNYGIIEYNAPRRYGNGKNGVYQRSVNGDKVSKLVKWGSW